MNAIPNKCCGFSLILTLWVVALLSVIAGNVAYSTRSEIAITRNLVNRAKADALAAAGVELGVLQLMSQVTEREWTPDQWRVDGTAYERAFGDGTVRIRIVSELGKIDINTAPESLILGLSRYGDALDLEYDLGALILDWRDRDKDPSHGGAEDSTYRALGLPYGARDGPFASLLELTQLPGLNRENAAPLFDLLTIYSRKNRLDPRTASVETLSLIPGITPDLVNNYVSLREVRMAEGLPVPDDVLSAFDGVVQIQQPSRNHYGFVYTVKSEGVLVDGTTAQRRVTIHLKRSRNRPYIVLQTWQPDLLDNGIGRGISE